MGRGRILKAGVLAAIAAAALAFGFGSSSASGGPPVNDNFATAQGIAGPFGTVTGSIAGATAEVVNPAAAADPNQYDINATLNHQFSGLPANNPATDPTNEPNHGDPAGPHNTNGVPVDGSGNPTVEYPPTGTQGTSVNPNPANQSIWFTWTASFTAMTTMDTIGSDFDTVMSVYTLHGLSTPPPMPQAQDLNLVAGNDDCSFLNNVGTSGASCVRFMAQAGTQYWIAVDASAPWNGPAGTDVTFNWFESAQNDRLGTATSVSPSASNISGSNVGGGNGVTIGGQTGANAVYYGWTPPVGTVQLGTSPSCGTGFNLLLGVFADAGGQLGGQVASVSIGSGTTNSTAFLADGSTHFFIVVEGQSSTDAGQFCLNALVTSGAAISLSKLVSPTTAHPGDILTYTLTVTDTSTDTPALGVNLTDPLPTGTTFSSASGSPGGCTNSGGSVTCTIGMVWPGAPVTVTINASLAPTVPVGSLVNSAQATALNAQSSSAQATTTVLPAADVSLTKTAMPASIHAGDNLSYSLVVTNNGPEAAVGVVLTDSFPAGTSFGSIVDPTSACTETLTTLTCPIGTMAVGASKTFQLTLTPPPGATSVTNTAFAGSATTFDPMPQNNSSSATTEIVPAADLSIVKTGPINAMGGDAVSYTIAVNNLGPSDAQNVVVTDQLPTDVVGAQVTGNGCSISVTNLVTCTVGTLANGGAYSATVGFTLSATTTITMLTNTASVASSTFDGNLANNSSLVSTAVTPLADLGISETADPATVSPGGTITYTITVTNNGPGASHPVVMDALQPDVSFSSASIGSCSTISNSVQCPLGLLASGASTFFTIVGTLSPTSNSQTVVNPVVVSAAELNDPNLTNNTATVSTAVSQLGCIVAGDVHANQNWTMIVGGKKVNVHVEIQGDCDFDKKTGKIFLHHAHVNFQVNGNSGVKFEAHSDDGKHQDVKSVLISSPSDAIVTGVGNGTPFTVTLHDGGDKKNGNDTVRVVYGGFDTATLSTNHGDVKIELDK